MSYTIRRLSDAEAEALRPALCELLADSVESGASIGFLPPLPPSEAENYWQAVAADVAAGRRVLLVAEQDGAIVGAAQLEFAAKPNARHRAEVQKLLVHASQRGHGIAGALMREIEALARQHGRTLVYLDTKQGDTAERLYERWGYTRAGVIPNYAANAEGTLDSTVIFYKSL
jgi:ribosomal protein S18 acetylase RimI-like enzyme